LRRSNQGFSEVVNGRQLKSINQFYNKKLAAIKSELSVKNKKKSSKRIKMLTAKRNNKIKNYIHKVSKHIVDLAVSKNCGNIVIGHNKGWKQKSAMSKKVNQNFVQIPFNMLIEQIKYKAEKYLDLTVTVVEESYTSKCDHLALEEMKSHNVFLGKRIRRGLFKSSTGKLINADINGAVGILRKANEISDGQLMSLRDRGDVVSPLKLNL
jgi:putative transposase